MTTELDIPKLRAQFEAATPGEWEVDSGHLFQGGKISSTEWFVRLPDDDVSIAADIIDPKTSEPSKANATLIATMHNTYAALLDRAEQADKYEAALREIADPHMKLHRRFFTTEIQVRAIAREALEEPDA